jgi:histidyl-tRNA synthetase
MLKCQKQNCSHIVIIGEKELETQTWSLKNLSDGTQESLSKEETLNRLKNL